VKLLILDIDETLLYATTSPLDRAPDFVAEPFPYRSSGWVSAAATARAAPVFPRLCPALCSSSTPVVGEDL
jgi:hypothetical protein